MNAAQGALFADPPPTVHGWGADVLADPDRAARYYAEWHWPGRGMSARDWRALRLRMTRASISRDAPCYNRCGWCICVTRADWRALVARFGPPGVFR